MKNNTLTLANVLLVAGCLMTGIRLKHAQQNTVNTLCIKNIAKGERVGRSKLNEKNVLVIKEMLRNGVRQRIIANKFGVSQLTISAIKTGKSWVHINV